MHPHIGVLYIIGIGAFGGILGAAFFQRLRVPQVVGYIVIGLIIGQSGLKIVGGEEIAALKNFNLFALGVIGFLVGGELKLESFRQYGRQFLAVLLGEGLMAFVLVGVGSGLVVYLVCHNSITALAAGLVFGAIASATDPASTIDVLWEYRARGVLTSALIAVVALDDALAMTLYGLGKSAAGLLVGGDTSILGELGQVGIDLGGAALLGAGMGALVAKLLPRIHSQDRALAVSIGGVLLMIGLSDALGLDLILSTMAMGMTLINMAPHRSHRLFGLVRSMSIPVYVVFFVLVGAGLSVGDMSWWMWSLVLIYVLGRNLGKMAGSYVGARVAKAEDVVRRYCGMGLFAQGGVAIGLAIVASEQFSQVPVTPDLSLAELIIFTITGTTLLMQLTGPAMVKYAARKAGELGRDVKEEDVLAELKVRDVMQPGEALLHDTDSLRTAVQVFSDHTQMVQPVVNSGGHVVGMIGFENLKEALPEQEVWDWLVCADMVQPIREKVTPDMPLQRALELLRDTNLDQLMVLDETASPPIPVGILDSRQVRQRVNEEILRRQSHVHAPTPALA